MLHLAWWFWYQTELLNKNCKLRLWIKALHWNQRVAISSPTECLPRLRDSTSFKSGGYIQVKFRLIKYSNWHHMKKASIPPFSHSFPRTPQQSCVLSFLKIFWNLLKSKMFILLALHRLIYWQRSGFPIMGVHGGASTLTCGCLH